MNEIQITLDMIDEFLFSIEKEGRKKQSIQTYRRSLQQWYESLPEDKIIAEDTLDRWVVALREKGIADNTLTNKVQTVKSFLKHLEFPVALHIKVPRVQRKKDPLKGVLTRSEYHLLLHATKESGNRRTYLLIKTIGGLGIRSIEIQELMVDHVKDGEMTLEEYEEILKDENEHSNKLENLFSLCGFQYERDKELYTFYDLLGDWDDSKIPPCEHQITPYHAPDQTYYFSDDELTALLADMKTLVGYHWYKKVEAHNIKLKNK